MPSPATMDAVAGLLKNMKLSEAEKKGVRGVSSGGHGSSSASPMAIGKVLAERLVPAEGLGIALGRVWCPIRGIECKDLGANHFLFTFNQQGGKKKALEDGPWVFGKDLIVVVDFDGKKRLEDLNFNHIPIWIRASGMPLGMMNRETGEAIGNEVGDFVDMDRDEDGSAVGQFLRIKVRLNISKPLMRGVSLMVDDDENPLWCPLVYEFLPEFCYKCGIIGHTDRSCAVEVTVGGGPQFSKKLRFVPEKKKWEENAGAGGSAGWRSGSWRSGSSGENDWRSGSRKYREQKSGSLSWRKEGLVAGVSADNSGEEQEEISPLKKFIPPHRREIHEMSARQKLALLDDKPNEGDDSSLKEHVTPGELSVTDKISIRPEQAAIDRCEENSDMEIVLDGEKGCDKAKTRDVAEKKERGIYKKLPRELSGKQVEGSLVKVGGKRSGDECDLTEVRGVEKKKKRQEGLGENERISISDAELANQLCDNQ